jgi:3-oxoacyl-[acyl-carrier protein] reductase
MRGQVLAVDNLVGLAQLVQAPPVGLRTTFSAAASKTGKSLDDVRLVQQSQVPARRFGTPDEFGAICAFLCSVHAGYMTGQNILPDGGLYAGTF